ncbi:MAG TPA: hypothetical protein VKD89_08760, partial [Candidatus Udaeobacter sp.]|nr:hypothetical protein [Candidatus Udaeobacter sp.]
AILKRTAEFDYEEPSDDELTAAAARVFEMLDRDEGDAASRRGVDCRSWSGAKDPTESKRGKNADYVCPKTQTAKIDPHGTTTVPIDGICINRNKPPVGKDVSGDLVMNTGDPTIPHSPDSHVPPNQAIDLLRICTAKYEAADKLQKDGALKDLPYKDREEQKKIVEQWSMWTDPEISKITGNPPATKDDLKKVVYKQLETQRPMSPETKEKVDPGIGTIFEKVELTTAKAKDLEKPEAPAGETTPAESPPSP